MCDLFRNFLIFADIIYMRDDDIIFITTTLGSKWLEYQKSIIKNLFPDSQHVIIDGSSNWPYAWFYWIDEIKKFKSKWFVHIDEDCFIESKDEIIRLIKKMDDEDYSISAVSDAYHHYRGANHVAINSFFMVGRVKDILDLNFEYSDMEFYLTNRGWMNSKNIIFDEVKHSVNFEYPHKIMGNGKNTDYEQEPYYSLLWKLKENDRKFYYLYPHFDDNFKSTNPRIDSNSPDIAIHMWYTRLWESDMDVHGLPNNERYRRIEKYLINKNVVQ
jgi:hypothetical protein